MRAFSTFLLGLFCLSFSGKILGQKEISGPVFMIDALNVSSLPENYRKADGSTQGAQNLPIIGSHQFSVQQFLTVLKQHPNIGAVLDLREEPHFFVNGQAITYYVSKNWADKGLPLPQIHQNEKKIYAFLKSQKHLVAFREERPQGTLVPTPLKISAVLAEDDFINSLGIKYLRLYNSDHMAPSPRNVDKFIQFVQSLPANAILFLHCRAGEGRTTTFMALYDMMKNAKTLSFEDILRRQHEIGGANLLKPAATGYKSSLEWQRLSFLKKFYKYARTNADNFQTTWSAYNQRKIHDKQKDK